MNVYIPKNIIMSTRFGWGNGNTTAEAVREIFPEIGLFTIDEEREQLNADWSAYQHLFALADWACGIGADKWALASGFDLLVDAIADGRVPNEQDISRALASGAEDFILVASASPKSAYPWDCLPPPRVQPHVEWERMEYMIQASPAPRAADTASIYGPILQKSSIGWCISTNPYAVQI